MHTKLWSEKPEYLGTDERKIWEWILRKWCAKVWTGYIWFKVRTN